MIRRNTAQAARRLFMVASVLAIALIYSSKAAGSLTQSELDAQRALWASHNVSDYDFIMQRQCLCIGDIVRPGVVAVRSDAILSVTDEETLAPLDPQYFFTINGLFDRLQHGLDVDADDIVVSFHSPLGYPTFMRIDYDAIVADEEDIFTARDLAVVPEPGSALLGLLAAVAIRCCHRGWRKHLR